MSNHPGFVVNLDILNPGQFFACCGLLELAHRLWPGLGVEGWFERKANTWRYSFYILISEDQFKEMLFKLANSEVEKLNGSQDPKLAPLLLKDPFNLRVDWWIDQRGEKTSFGKMFAGNKSTFVDMQRLLQVLKEKIKKGSDKLEDVFDWTCPLPGRFGVDPRAAWDSLRVGFSPNTQQIKADTFFVVELLGAIGLQTSLPRKIKETYAYSPWLKRLPAIIARAAAAGLIPELSAGHFQFSLVERGSYRAFSKAKLLG
jgi:hypothetical protein